METTETLVPEHYNPNQLVTYKVINNGETTYPTSKVVDLEWQLETARYTDRQLASLRLSANNLEDILPKWLEEDTDAAEIVSDICQIFGFNPTKEIEFEATATITGRVSVPLADLSTFDVEDIDLTVYADSHTHDIDVDIEVDNITTL